MGFLKFAKYGKEYRSELFRTPYFWVGAGLIILGGALGFSGLINVTIQMVLMILGFVFIIATKQRILGRLEERHFKKK